MKGSVRTPFGILPLSARQVASKANVLKPLIPFAVPLGVGAPAKPRAGTVWLPVRLRFNWPPVEISTRDKVLERSGGLGGETEDDGSTEVSVPM